MYRCEELGLTFLMKKMKLFQLVDVLLGMSICVCMYSRGKLAAVFKTWASEEQIARNYHLPRPTKPCSCLCSLCWCWWSLLPQNTADTQHWDHCPLGSRILFSRAVLQIVFSLPIKSSFFPGGGLCICPCWISQGWPMGRWISSLKLVPLYSELQPLSILTGPQNLVATANTFTPCRPWIKKKLNSKAEWQTHAVLCFLTACG